MDSSDLMNSVNVTASDTGDPFPGTYTQHLYDADWAWGGATIVCLPDRRMYGLSVASEKDQFSRKVGRQKAYDRAQLAKGTGIPGVVIVTPNISPAQDSYFWSWNAPGMIGWEALGIILDRICWRNPGESITILTEADAREAQLL